MYVDTQVRPQGEQVDAVAPAKLKLSQAIRMGAEEVAHDPYRRAYRSCAIGAAHWALHGERFNPESGGYHIGTTAEQWATEHGFDPKITREVQRKFDHEELTHYEIAAWLEAQGL